MAVREIGQELAKVAVIAPAELVLDDDLAVVGLCYEVDTEVAGADLFLRVGQPESELGTLSSSPM